MCLGKWWDGVGWVCMCVYVLYSPYCIKWVGPCICKLVSFSSREFFCIISLTVSFFKFYLVFLSEIPIFVMLDFLDCSSNYLGFFLLLFPFICIFYLISQRFFSNVFSNTSIKFNFCFHIFNFQEHILVFWVFLPIVCSCITMQYVLLPSNKLIFFNVFICSAMP